MIPLLINGQNLHGRPIEFDSDVANQKTMENAFGNPVKPTKISTCCPDCGQGLEFDLTLGDPPYSSVEVTCYICNPAAPPPVDPFMNPLEDGRVPGHDLDPLLHNPNEQVVVDEDDDTTLADRLEFPTDESVEESIAEETEETEETEENPELAGFDSAGGASSIIPPQTTEEGTPKKGDWRGVISEEIPIREPDDGGQPFLDTNPTGDSVEVPEELVVASDEEPPVEPPAIPEIDEEAEEVPPKAKKNATRKKKTPKKPKPKVAIEPADGMTAEVDIEEDDLAEQE